MNSQVAARIRGRRVLLLQGPVGPCFQRLADALLERGAELIHKINFNGGDAAFYPEGEPYTGTLDDWPAHLAAVCDRLGIDAIVLFGDCRPVHAGVSEVAGERGILVHVLEEGYFRPAYVTCETGGANGYSSIPSDPEFYKKRELPPEATPAPPPRFAYWIMAWWATLYYVACHLQRDSFPHYQHHRTLYLWKEAGRWVRGACRKWIFRIAELGIAKHLASSRRPFFLVPLQVHNDAQVVVHSPYADVPAFIEQVIGSFAEHAPPQARLVIKHHPMDRAYTDYTWLIKRLAQRHRLGRRVVYIHDQHLPTLLDACHGAIVINSTVGLSAIHQGVATKVMGKAFYDFAGLTFQGSLHAFWGAAGRSSPDPALYRNFRRWVIAQTQANDNFYAPIRRGKMVLQNNESRHQDGNGIGRRAEGAGEAG